MAELSLAVSAPEPLLGFWHAALLPLPKPKPKQRL
ncbi:unnamed protein product [Gulo gulo]|uniref:Uncharacterized protein n=1 Tax=Gulo gulo TaxID=48420 RepID=A0A9X9LLZ5_GULGU|nr:unnamed protein product [Gulo gulo]